MKNNIIKLGLIALASMMLASPVYAEEKTLTADLAKDYTTAKFNILFDNPGKYEVTIESPSDKKEYAATQTKQTAAECIIQDAKKGKWTIKIKSQGGDLVYDPEKNEMVEQEGPEIGPVHIEIQGSAQEVAEVNQDIKVAADIAGLKMYFRDETFVAEWSENTDGAVYVEITDARTLEKLAADNVSDHVYECNIDPSAHENIVVTLVPAESAQVENAERRWTMTTKNHPDAAFVFPEERVTNKDAIQAHAVLGQPYFIEAYVNNRIIYKSDELAAGEYDLDLETDVGENDYILYVIDPETGYMRSSTYSIIKDVVAPAVKLAKSYENITTEDESIIFEGSIDPDYNSFTINDADIKVEGDHTFKYEYELKEGVNNITILASDEAGNVSEYNTTITRVVPEVAKVPWFPIIIGCCLVGLAVTYIVSIVIKNRRGDTEDDDYDRPRRKKKGSKGDKKDRPKRDVIDPKISFAIRVLIPVLGVMFILNYVIAATTVETGSMEPKLVVGNLAVYNRWSYKKAEPERGDIILYYSDEFNVNMAKRVIGIPGDHIQFIDGFVFINGQRADESEYIAPDVETNCFETFDVPENTVFVLGDNREYSYDSRFFNQPYIPYKKIIGKYMGQSEFNAKYMIEQRLKKKDDEGEPVEEDKTPSVEAQSESAQ